MRQKRPIQKSSHEKTKSSTTSVLVIGAGPAGLAAARILEEKKISFLILEARDRVGGRASTIGKSYPIELGPEFIHGDPKKQIKLYESLGASPYEVPDTHLIFENGKLTRQDDFFEVLSKSAKKVKVPKSDLSFFEALEEAKLTEEKKQLLRSFAQGFDVANIGDASAKDLLAAIHEAEDQNLIRVEKLESGYSPIFEQMSQPFVAKIKLNTEVKRIAWKNGQVEVKTTDGEIFSAKRALITVPLGVLKSPEGIRFFPPLMSHEKAWDRLAMGSVAKLMLEFKKDFWSEKLPEPASMLHAPHFQFHTWWTALPMHWPVLTAWSGGDPAEKLLKLPREEIEKVAVSECARLFHVSEQTVKRQLKEIHFHDWSADPYSRGAYSYVRTGGEGARRSLGRSVSGTLYFAGEATSEEENGTVNGAISTGERNARKMISSLRR